MNNGKINELTPFLACVALSVAMPCQITRAAPPGSARPEMHVSVSGISRGYTHDALRGLISRGVSAALANDRAAATHWSFSIQTAPGNRPETQIAATLQSGNALAVSGFFTSPDLGTAPSSVFIEEIREFAKRLLRRSDA
jgi:hypothetical protein